MKKKLKILSLVVVTVLLHLSCGSDEVVVQQTAPQTAKIEKEPEMIRFEKSLAGMGSKYSSQDQKVAYEARELVTASAVNYLAYYGQTVDKNADEFQILTQALRFHAAKIKELKINQNR